MKVLVVSHLWPRRDFPFLGIFVADQAAALKKYCDVRVLSPVDRTFRAEELSPGQIFSGCPKYRRRVRPELISDTVIQPQTINYRAPVFRHTFAAGTAGNLARALEKTNLSDINLVHAHTLFPDGLACAIWLRDKSIPLVVTAHGSDLHSMTGRVGQAINPLWERADRLIAVSSALRDQLEVLGAPTQKISVMPNGFSADLFRDAGVKSERGKKLVFLGQPRPVKRVDLLIRALAYCPADVTLDIAGESPLLGLLKALTRQLGLTDRIRFLGTVERQHVPQLLAGSALLCLVSSREGWPTVIFEAMACGTPVLATAVGGIPEALSNPDRGVLVPVDVNPQALAQAIMAALERPWDRAAIREQALGYSWEALAEKIYQIYRQTTGATAMSEDKVSSQVNR